MIVKLLQEDISARRKPREHLTYLATAQKPAAFHQQNAVMLSGITK